MYEKSQRFCNKMSYVYVEKIKLLKTLKQSYEYR